MSDQRKLTIVVGILVLMIIGARASEITSGKAVPVLLELFTSEGCSSCPPADRLLEVFDKTQPVMSARLIVLSEHVDYWDGLGWKDPYSSMALTDRQREYGHRFHLDGVYTPQLVVDGRFELVGSRGSEAREVIERALHETKVPVAVSVSQRQDNEIPIHVDVPPLPTGAGAATVFLAVAEDHAQSRVQRGENAGRILSHVAVVHTLIRLGRITGGASFTRDINVPAPNGAAHGVRFVAFVQDNSTGHVLGVAQQGN